jgi:hypothetical protein
MFVLVRLGRIRTRNARNPTPPTTGTTRKE